MHIFRIQCNKTLHLGKIRQKGTYWQKKRPKLLKLRAFFSFVDEVVRYTVFEYNALHIAVRNDDVFDCG